jgi:hypothetical protein
MNMNKLRWPAAALLALGMAACGGGGGPGPFPPQPPVPPVPPSSAKAITAFRFADPSTTGGINEGAKIITVGVPPSTGSSMVPLITHTGASISPPSGEAQDFTGPVTYTVTAEDGSTAVYTVTVKEALLSAAAVEASLTAASGGLSGNDPVPLAVAVELSAAGWTALFSAIDGAGKYVALDLSACPMTGPEFDPGAANTGTSKIVSLTLPDAAAGIKARSYSAPTFQHFTGLTGVTGAHVTSVGEYAFFGCTTLEAVDLPAAVTISYNAFEGCTALEAVNLPAAVTISYNAFKGCTGLSTISLPAAVTIDGSAFKG